MRRDSSDRLLVIRAIQDDLSLVLAERTLIEVGGQVTWVPARAPEG